MKLKEQKINNKEFKRSAKKHEVPPINKTKKHIQ